MNFTPYPMQKKYLYNNSHRKLLRTANQVGKSKVAAAEALMSARGEHPNRGDLPVPNKGLIITPTLNQAISGMMTKIKEMMTSEELELNNWTKNGFGSSIKFPNGSEIFFKYSGQDTSTIAGGTYHWTHIDEPPEEHHWGEIMARTAASNGNGGDYISMTFTPIGELTWLETIINNDEAGWEDINFSISPETVPWKTAEQIQSFINSLPEWERPQRVHGAWRGPNNARIFDRFNDVTCIDDRLFSRGEKFTTDKKNVYEKVFFGLSMDYGTQEGKNVSLLWAIFLPVHNSSVLSRIPRRLVIYDETISSRQTPTEDAADIKEMLKRNGLSLSDIYGAVGDINGGGKAVADVSVNQLLSTALGLNNSFIKAAEKANVSAQCTKVNELFFKGELKVNSRCKKVISSLNNWSTKNGSFDPHSEWKDACDAARYGANHFKFKGI